MRTEFDNDWDAFEDVITEVMCDINPPSTAKYYIKENIEKLFSLLPIHIKFDAYEWGLNDTVFRDNAYEWLLNNWDNVGELI